MIFNEHSELEGLHAFLAPSKYHWFNYDKDKLLSTYRNHQARQMGTRLHAFAAEAILLGRRQAGKDTLALYINDAIGFKLTPEQPLYYSPYCFGTADAIGFRKNFLRIHDYKSGESPTSMGQLLVYAALYCLEYKYEPEKIGNELRIYQNNEIDIQTAPPEAIRSVMEKIVEHTKVINDDTKGE